MVWLAASLLPCLTAHHHDFQQDCRKNDAPTDFRRITPTEQDLSAMIRYTRLQAGFRYTASRFKIIFADTRQGQVAFDDVRVSGPMLQGFAGIQLTAEMSVSPDQSETGRCG